MTVTAPVSALRVPRGPQLGKTPRESAAFALPAIQYNVIGWADSTRFNIGFLVLTTYGSSHTYFAYLDYCTHICICLNDVALTTQSQQTWEVNM